ncbi:MULTISPECIES: mechanosensitive ion channel family protein [Bacillus]|uniref:mechanosensitive ion channel family protein n=1 Tax=Bacillus TaxID=1386 RepID=UPI000BB97703|nr:mechanosensitive ion channel family protein [Bacillus alkalisoli]
MLDFIINSYTNTPTYAFWTDYEFLKQLGIAIGVLLLFLLWRNIFTKYVFKLILAISKRTPTDLFTYIVLSFEKPLRMFFVVIGIYFALDLAPFTLIGEETVKSIFRSFVIFFIGWGLFNFVPYSLRLFSTLSNRLDLEVDQIILPFFTKVLRFIVVALAISIVLEEWEYNVSGLVAGLGLGGLAFALAAQESLKNLLGGFIIITERPFSIGEWVKTPSVEGVVEDISFRSTKIRTFAQAVVTVPNSTLANEPIINWSKMGKRQITFQLGVQYDTKKRSLERVVRRIESMLHEHEEIHNETIMVRFDNFGDSSLNIFLYFFTNTIMWAEFLRVKEDINFKIMEILEEEGVSVAFPTRTLHIESMPEDERKRLLSSSN